MKTIPYKEELTEEHIENIVEWIQALESEQYSQCRSKLTRDGDSYCCLGVASVIKSCPLSDDLKHIIYGNQERTLTPDPDWFLKTYGFRYERSIVYDSCEAHFNLAQLNDRGYTFEQIAKIIKASYIDRVETEV